MTDTPVSSPLQPLMRRVALTVGVTSLVGVVVALVLNGPWVAVGIPVGVALTVFNMRLLDRQVARVSIGDPDDTRARKAARGAVTRSAGLRLAVVTTVVVVSLIIAWEFSTGIVIGLAISQSVFVVNAFGVVSAELKTRSDS
jgi:hypothetical protein